MSNVSTNTVSPRAALLVNLMSNLGLLQDKALIPIFFSSPLEQKTPKHLLHVSFPSLAVNFRTFILGWVSKSDDCWIQQCAAGLHIVLVQTNLSAGTLHLHECFHYYWAFMVYLAMMPQSKMEEWKSIAKSSFGFKVLLRSRFRIVLICIISCFMVGKKLWSHSPIKWK